MASLRPQRSGSTHRGGLWDIQILGGLRMLNGDRVSAKFPTRHVVELLALLLLHPSRSLSREELIDRLWPMADLAAGRNRLRNALSQLKALFGHPVLGEAGVIVTEGDTVRLNTEAVVCDVIEFRHHVRQGRAAAARACYRGELLPGFYAEWLQEERLALEAVYGRLASADAPRLPFSEGDVAPIRGSTLAPAGARHRLPSYLTAFFGREKEVQEVADALAVHRCVTVTGMGGCGKTRLCVEIARRERRFDLACLVRLDECTDPALIADHVREALGLQAGAPSALRQIVASMEGQRLLLVLDNLEQLVGVAATATFEELLARLPGLHLLISSQVALRAPFEHDYPLMPLPLPHVGVAAQHAQVNPSVALFMHRAREVRADFNLHARNVEPIVALCRAAEGLPLIIELAASRLRSLSVRQICDAMAGNWSPLKRTRETGRHSSLINAIQWSLDLLNAQQRAFLDSLSVLRADWTELDAAEVTGAPTTLCHAHLAQLTDVSMVQAHTGERGELRFHVPRHIADLVGAGLSAEQRLPLRAQHRRCFLSRTTSAIEAGRALDDAEAANALQALTTAVADGDWDATGRLALAMGRHWNARGLSDEAATLLRRICADVANLADAAASPLIGMAARLLVQNGQVADARELADLAFRHATTDETRAEAMLARISVLWRVDREAAPLLDAAREALRLARASASPDLIARALRQLGPLAAGAGEPLEDALAMFREAEAICRRYGDEAGALAALPGLTFCLSAQGSYIEAIALSQQGLQQAQTLGNVDLQLLLFNRMGYAAEGLRRHRQALSAYEEQARVAHRHGMAYHLAYAIWNQCTPLVKLKKSERAAMLMAFSKRYWLEHFGPIKSEDNAVLREVRRAVVERAGPTQWRRWWAAGWALSLPRALALANPPTTQVRPGVRKI